MRAAKLLSRRHLRRRCLVPPSDSHPFIPLSNPNSFFSSSSSSNLFCPYRLAASRLRPSSPNLHPPPSNISCRSFSWHAWTGAPDSGGGRTEESSATGSELSNLEIDGSGMLEEAVGESAWYHPLVRPVISLLDGFHDLTGLPWWVVIFTGTLAFRMALLPVLILQLKKVGEIAAVLPKLPPPFPPPLSGRSFQEQYMLFQEKRRELGCPSYFWNFAFLAVQFPCFLLWMTGIRRMCLDHHPGFDSGGTLWFHNLTDFPHGTLGPVFPILVAGLHYAIVQISFQRFKVVKMHGIIGLLAKYYKLYLDLLAVPLLLIGFHVPQGSLVYWVTSSTLTLVQQFSLTNPHVRKKLGLPDGEVPSKNKISTEDVLHKRSSTSEHKGSAETLCPEKLLDLALEYLAAGLLDEALPLLRRATERDPELVRALIAMGEIFCSKGSFVEAAEYFERAIPKIQDQDVGLLVLATFGAGVSNVWQGRKSEGIEHLKRITQLREPEEPMERACYYKGFVMLGSVLFQEGKRSEAAKYLRIAAAYDPAVNTYVKECEEG